MRLASAEVGARPLIDPGYLTEPADLEASLAALDLCLEIFAQPALARRLSAPLLPAEPLTDRAARMAFLRAHGHSAYHPVGTCRMGTDAEAVVDPALRVRGIDGLRVADSSIMPSLIGSNTNGATIMIAEKASDLVRQDGSKSVASQGA